MLAWGLVNQVVPHGDLLPAALSLAADICPNDPRAVRALRALYDQNAAEAGAAGLAREYRVARQWRGEAFSPDIARDQGRRHRARPQPTQPAPAP